MLDENIVLAISVSPIVVFFFFMLANAVTIIVLLLILIDVKYRKSAYYVCTKRNYFSMVNDIGCYGEYLTYTKLKKYEEQGAKFLFNLYIPKEDSETSEIDVLMICDKGVFVFESKNYSGWIFGDVYQKNWYQTLPSGRKKSHKEVFYNPIMQNYSHIKYLSRYISEGIPLYSVIVFSERCELKNVKVKNPDIKVVKRYDVAETVEDVYSAAPKVLSAEAIQQLYDKLFPLTQVDSSVKLKHIEDINEKYKSKECSPETESPATIADSKVDESVEANVSDVSQTDSSALDLVCPKCGGKLLLRTAKRGTNIGNKFYGCENYPKCKYTKPISDDKCE